jgi:hypothetical protein
MIVDELGRGPTALAVPLDENPDAVVARRDDAQPQVARRIGEIADPAEFEIDLMRPWKSLFAMHGDISNMLRPIGISP